MDTIALADVEVGVMNILDHTGDTEISWDPRNPVETQNAREQFNKFTGKEHRYLAYRVEGSDKGAALKEFDPNARRIILSKQSVGG